MGPCVGGIDRGRTLYASLSCPGGKHHIDRNCGPQTDNLPVCLEHVASGPGHLGNLSGNPTDRSADRNASDRRCNALPGLRQTGNLK